MRFLLIFLLQLFATGYSQDFLSFISPFFGSALGPSPKPKGLGGLGGHGGGRGPSSSGSPIQSLLSQFTGGNTEYGGNNPFIDIARLGISALSDQKAPGRSANSPLASPKMKPHPPPSALKKNPKKGGNPKKPPPPTRSPPRKPKTTAQAGKFSLAPLFNTDFTKLIPAPFKFNNGKSSQPGLNFPMPPTNAPWLKASEVPRLPENPTVKAFGQKVGVMLEEISQYSDVHQQRDQDYGSVQRLLTSFFHAMAGEPDNAPDAKLAAMNDGTETGRNRPLSRNLFESDIVLTAEQLKSIVLAERDRRVGKHSKRRRRTKRKVITGGIYRWPNQRAIPYEFKEKDEQWRKLIRSALAYWQSETCLRWQENGPGFDRVVFFRGSGCYSSVGKTGGRQTISIGYGCEDRGIVTHEVGHSIGFWHEQSRPDRDKYIQIDYKHIAKGTEGNFVKRTTLESDDMGLPFDLGSVMHYGPSAFTTDGTHTIETKDKKYEHTIGQRMGPSFIDVKQANRLYCHNACGNSQLPCKNGGYQDPNNCQVCKCPPGLGGQLCDQVQPSTCGSELAATDVWQHLTYKGKEKCYWRIKALGHRVRIILDSVSLRCGTTCRSFVEIKHNSDFQQTGFRACCDEKELGVVSEQDEMLILFDPNGMDKGGAFTLRYIKDTGMPLPKPPPAVWIPGNENRLFRNIESGSIEKFILNAIPQIRDPNRPMESIASIVTDFTIGTLLGVSRD